MMEIKAVIISGELPDGCLFCDLSRFWHFGKSICHITKKTIWAENKPVRPDWCPLVRKDLYDMEIIQNFVGKESEE